MRALFTTLPAYGHLHPLLPFARALREAGHEVAFATAPLFCPAVEAMGFEARPAGHDWLAERAQDFFPGARDAVEAGQSAGWLMRELAYGPPLDPMVRDLLELIDAWRPDVLVRDLVEAGAIVAGELTGTPAASGSWGIGPREEWALDGADRWNEARARWGLGPDAGGAAAARWLVLSAMPPSWTALSAADQATTHSFVVRPLDARPGDALPGWLTARDPQRPLLYATAGTVFNAAERVFEKIAVAVEDLPLDVLLTVGRNVDPLELEPLPANVRAERYVPQSLLMAHCDLVLSQAGFGTVHAALSAGVPMVLMALGTDHATNVQRAVALGVARAVPPGRLDVGTLRALIASALEDGVQRERCAAIRDEMAGLPPVGRAADLLERLARERQPMVAQAP